MESLYPIFQNLQRERDSLAYIVSRTSDCCNSILQLANKYELQNDEKDALLISKVKAFLKNSQFEEISYNENGQMILNQNNEGRVFKEEMEKLEDLMTDFFIQLRTESLNVFDVVGGNQTACSEFINYLSKESENLMEATKIQVEKLVNTNPDKVVVVKEHLRADNIPVNFEDNLINKARNITKNLRSALSEAECVKTDPAEDREFDYIWNKLHEDAEASVQDEAHREIVDKLEMLLNEKQKALDRMEEEFETQKMLHERETRDLKKENDMLMRDMKNMKKDPMMSGKNSYSYFGQTGSDFDGNFEANFVDRGFNFDDIMQKNKLLRTQIKEREGEIGAYEGKISYLNKRIKDLERMTGTDNTEMKKRDEDVSIDPSFLDSMRPGVSAVSQYDNVSHNHNNM